jgi:hypothetical protein
MSSTYTFFVGITVQVLLGFLQVSAAIVFVYRWQRRSWRFSNIMKIREPLARAYCSLSAVERARIRIVEEAANKTAADHDHELMLKYLEAAQEEIVNFSVEHFKARFWLSQIENSQLDVLFDKLRLEWRTMRNEGIRHVDHLDDVRSEILRFDVICGLRKLHAAQWSHVALHE